MNIEKAINWCIQEQAEVSFYRDYGKNKVRIRIGGYNFVEKNSFLEAVETLEKFVEEKRLTLLT